MAIPLNVKPAASGDDGLWYSSTLSNTDTWIILGKLVAVSYNGFIRFPGINIPPGSVIDTAILRIGARFADTDNDCNVNIYFNDVDTAVVPATAAEANALALTGAVAWNAVGTWVQFTEYDSPDLAAILQTIIDRPGWASGQAVMAIIKDNASTASAHRYGCAYDYDNATVDFIELRITFTSADVTAVPFEAVVSGIAAIGISVTAVPFAAVTSGVADYELNNHGLAAATLPLFTCAAEGTVQSGSLEQDLPMLTISAHGVQGEVGHLNVTLPKLQLSASGSCSLEGVTGDLDADLPAITLVSSGLCGQLGNLDQVLPQFTISATGYTKVMGDADLDLPMFYIYASGHQTAAAVVAADYLVLAMNPKNMAVSEYDWSGFNSFVYFNGVYLGAKAGTIHVLGGDDDSGSIIESEIELGQIPVDLVKPRDVYVLGRADGMMALTVQADEDTEKEVNIAYMLETLNLDRAKIPRGLQPTYFSLKLENQNGSDFDIDEIQVWGEIIGR